MSAATAEGTALEQDAMVSAPKLSVLYASRRSNLRLVKKAIRPVRNAEGMQTDTVPGETVAFKDGRLEIPSDGPLQLEDGERVDPAPIVQWLEKHRMNGDVQEGFWKVNLSAPEPTKDELDKLVELAVAGDVEGLSRFMAQEREGWARPTLLEVAQDTLAATEKRAQEIDAQVAAARAEGEAASKSKDPPAK